jgi:hypothetical protein
VLAAMEKPSDGDIEIWPEMVPAVSLFFAMQTQWQWVGAGMGGAFRTGLNYSSLPTVAASIKVDVGAEVLHDLRSLETAALAVLNKR